MCIMIVKLGCWVRLSKSEKVDRRLRVFSLKILFLCAVFNFNLGLQSHQFNVSTGKRKILLELGNIYWLFIVAAMQQSLL